MEESLRYPSLARLTPGPVADHNHLPPHSRHSCRACLSHSPHRQGPISNSPHHLRRPGYTSLPIRHCGTRYSRNELPFRCSTKKNDIIGALQLFEMDHTIFSAFFGSLWWNYLLEHPVIVSDSVGFCIRSPLIKSSFLSNLSLLRVPPA